MTHSEEPVGREPAGPPSAPPAAAGRTGSTLFRPGRSRLARGHAVRRYVRACQEAVRARAALRTTTLPTTALPTTTPGTTVTRSTVTRRRSA